MAGARDRQGRGCDGDGAAVLQCVEPTRYLGPLSEPGQASPSSGLLERGEGVLCRAAGKAFPCRIHRGENINKVLLLSCLRIWRCGMVGTGENSGGS